MPSNLVSDDCLSLQLPCLAPNLSSTGYGSQVFWAGLTGYTSPKALGQTLPLILPQRSLEDLAFQPEFSNKAPGGPAGTGHQEMLYPSPFCFDLWGAWGHMSHIHSSSLTSVFGLNTAPGEVGIFVLKLALDPCVQSAELIHKVSSYSLRK